MLDVLQQYMQSGVTASEMRRAMLDFVIGIYDRYQIFDELSDLDDLFLSLSAPDKYHQAACRADNKEITFLYSEVTRA